MLSSLKVSALEIELPGATCELAARVVRLVIQELELKSSGFRRMLVLSGPGSNFHHAAR